MYRLGMFCSWVVLTAVLSTGCGSPAEKPAEKKAPAMEKPAEKSKSAAPALPAAPATTTKQAATPSAEMMKQAPPAAKPDGQPAAATAPNAAAPAAAAAPASSETKGTRDIVVEVTTNPTGADLVLVGEGSDETPLGKAPYTHKAKINVEREPHADGADRFFINGGDGISYDLTYPDGSNSTVIHFRAKAGGKSGEAKIVLNPQAVWKGATKYKEEIVLH